MPLIRKELAGSDSHGHTWAEDGAVVEIEDPEQVAALVAIPDGGFSEVTPHSTDTDTAGALPDDSGTGPEFSEVDPTDETVEAPKTPGRRGRRLAAQE
ncbi:hypothetical protein [Streptomyces sp. URMC 124]|uniref:hypothetical protein n=1 Tax=Streptomyces sp. URMC 124 TaxID=3423405 RepID=UPI003F1DBF16